MQVAPALIGIALAIVVGIVGVVALWGGQRVQVDDTDESQTAAEAQANAEEQREQQRAQEFVDGLTLEQKVAQLFVVRPEALTGVNVATEAGTATRDAIAKYPVGGFLYSKENLIDAQQVKRLLKNTQNYTKDASGLPAFLCVEEEGGQNGSIAAAYVESSDVESAARIGASNDAEKARDAARTVGSYVSNLGFNVNVAPVADIVSSDDSELADRSFGDDPETVAKMASAQVDGYTRTGILCAVEHFPGIGESEQDPHNGRLYSHRKVDEILQREVVPFTRSIEAGVPIVLVGNISYLEIGNGEGDVPAWMSKALVSDVLRSRLGFSGVAMTDKLDDKAVTDACDVSEQAVRALNAGMDVMLCPQDFERAYKGLLSAVEKGEISEERIDESVVRIVRVKQRLAD